ncbi:MAG: hypothetical protein GEU26_11940 [Nitrososphaeraceae archaeon]|nr:hypothetical protein [Nitrososphaeraceae archaeon]
MQTGITYKEIRHFLDSPLEVGASDRSILTIIAVSHSTTNNILNCGLRSQRRNAHLMRVVNNSVPVDIESATLSPNESNGIY